MKNIKSLIFMSLCCMQLSSNSLRGAPSYEKLIELMNTSEQKLQQLHNDHNKKTQDLYQQYAQTYYLLKLECARGTITKDVFQLSVLELQFKHMKQLAALNALADAKYKQALQESARKRKELLS
ncbi:MAG TPA: hypothetical protein VLG50_04780 [Candidatus Saccharimonadales bacterium]|nr:hypothetical protein [Candidatus Saccharimonadales bacterium]